MIEPQRLDYPLTAASLVWDLGAYRGEFAHAILERYGCHVMAFEPVPEFCQVIKQQPVKRGFLELHEFGLCDRSYRADMKLAGDRTTVHDIDLPELYIPGRPVNCEFRSVIEFMDARKVKQVDLAKINIEGDEYRLLFSLIGADYIARFKHLQIQFHRFVPEFGEKYLAIKKGLQRTHDLQWRTPWEWESWARR